MESPARKVALEILCLDEKRSFRASPFQGGAFQRLSPRDRALCEELVMGTWRWRNVLDEVIVPWLDRPLDQLDLEVKQALRLGAYQILFSRIPPPVAVSATVDVAGPGRGGRALVNAVLRRVAEHAGHVEMPPREDVEAYIEKRFSHPRWVARRFIRYFGEDEAVRLAAFNQRVPEVCLRVNKLKADREQVLDALRKMGVDARPGLYFETSIRLLRPGAVSRLPGYSEGWFSVQDEAAMAVAVVVDPRPGERVWDVCAAPGGKTVHLAEIMNDTGVVVATDAHAGGLERLNLSAERLGLRNIRTMNLDVTDPEAVRRVAGPFDRVLVDAPCTGLGVLRRRPDVRWHRKEEDVAALANLQKRILDVVAPLVRPGGVLVYSTCTLTHEENEEVFSHFLERHPDFSISDPLPLLPDELRKGFLSQRGERDGRLPGTLTFLPHVHRTDGFFIARAERAAIR